MQASDAASVADERAKEVAAVEREASYVELLGYNVDLVDECKRGMVM